MSSLFLRAQGVQFGYSEPLLSDVSFQAGPGWTGVVGPNGAGKTTLLRLLAGELSPDAGVVRAPGRVVLCPQLVPDEPASHGERKRAQLASALRAGAQVLLLDEPTNHLDARARDWVLRELSQFAGVGIVVSHDRALLDALCTGTLRVAGGTARLYPGGYSQARALWEAEERELRDQAATLSAREQALRARLADARREQQAASAQRSTGRRMRGPRDSDARGLGADFRAQQAEKKHGRRVEVLRRAHERAVRDLPALDRQPGAPVYVGYERCPRPWLARGEPAPVAREDRIWVSGPNGAGKSTLLARLHETMPRERVLFLPQDLDAAGARAALAEVRALPPDLRGRVLTVVAALGVDPGRLLASRQPSPGEARKLLIARGLGTHAWALLLDEPTNHLDLPSVERLEAALRAYPGALLLVTHDDLLAAACCTRRWLVSPGVPVREAP